MEKQRLLEMRKHGTPMFPIECFVTNAEGDRLLVQLHWHKNIEIMQLFSGTAEVMIGTETFLGFAGDIFVINQEELHRIVSSDPTLSYGTLIFPMESLSFAANDSAQTYLEPLIRNTMRFPVRITKPEQVEIISGILTQILYTMEQKEVGYELTVKVYLLQIISELIRQRQLITVQQCLSQKSERLKQIIEYIRKNYSTQLTIAAMADEFHMSEKYFSRYFRNATGQNFTAYLNTIRIKQACTLLRETDRTVLEIAFECGYENVSYFNRVFRSQMGISPLQYRNTSDYIQ